MDGDNSTDSPDWCLGLEFNYEKVASCGVAFPNVKMMEEQSNLR